MQNITLAPVTLKLKTQEEAEKKALELLERVGLTEKANVYPSTLSGGQKQRLALARAILHDAKIYIFDEATSNIDMESEEIILEEIKKLAKSKTVIMITHRLMNVVDADKIYCLEKGQISGEGKHQELLETDFVYKKLWNTQKALEEYGRGGEMA